RFAVAIHLFALEGEMCPRATVAEQVPRLEAGLLDAQPLAVFGADEPVAFLGVEPDQPAAHATPSCATCARRSGRAGAGARAPAHRWSALGRDERDVLGLGALGALGSVELHLCVLVEGLVALA